jgi:hypothetical protein
VSAVEPGHQRHTDVRQHEVGHDPENSRQALAAVVRDRDRIAAIDQLFRDQGGGFPVVLDAKDLLLGLHALVRKRDVAATTSASSCKNVVSGAFLGRASFRGCFFHI